MYFESKNLEYLRDLFGAMLGGPSAKALRIYEDGKVQWQDDDGEWHDHDPTQSLRLS